MILKIHFHLDGLGTSKEFLYAQDLPNNISLEEKLRIRRIRVSLLFIESYQDLPLLAWPRLLLDKVAELEESLVLFRTHHARMVERIIGRRVGTGGSSGVDYLDETAKYRIFPELWIVRAMVLPRTNVPELLMPEVYGFVATERKKSFGNTAVER